MLKELITSHSAETGLVLFVISFIAITVYAITRSKKELDRWSDLPLREPCAQAIAPSALEEPHE